MRPHLPKPQMLLSVISDVRMAIVLAPAIYDIEGNTPSRNNNNNTHLKHSMYTQNEKLTTNTAKM